MYPARRSAFPAAGNPFASGPTTATASVQVHYLWVAGRYRDLSSERGLGLAADAHALGAIPEVGDGSDHSGSRPASAHHQHPSSNRKPAPLNDRKINPFLDIRNFQDAAAGAAPGSGATGGSRSAGVHGARHGSLRSYAADRLKSQEQLESRIARTTDVERLKWEAKSALLNNSHALAVLLFARAGVLGSISSCITLAKIYSSGVTRGSSPRIVVLKRDPLRALAWVLEAFRLLQRRLEPTKYGAAVYQQSSSISEAWSAEQRQGLEETFRSCELLIRLLRTSQAGLLDLNNDPTVLPDIKSQQHLKSKPASKDANGNSRPPEVRLLWDEVASVIRWLETRLERSVALARHRANQPESAAVADPDDEFDQDETAEHLEALTVQLAYLRAVQALKTCLRVRTKEAVRSAKERWAQSLAAASSSHCPAGMDDLVPLAEAGLALIHALPQDGWTAERNSALEEAAVDYTLRVDEGLTELSVPAVDDVALDKENQAVNAARNSEVESTSLSKPRASAKKERPKSLQDLAPVDVDSVSDAVRSKQLNLTQRLIGESQPSTAGVVSIQAQGQQHLPRYHSAPYGGSSNDYARIRAPSFTGLTTASFVAGRLTSPSIIGLDSGSIAPGSKDFLFAPSRDPDFSFPQQKRPSSIVSDTPSLLFGPSGDAAEESSPPTGRVDAKVDGPPSRPSLTRKRVVSMYGITPATGATATSAPAERVAFPTVDNQGAAAASPGISRTHKSSLGTTALDSLSHTLRNASSTSQGASSARSLFLGVSYGRSMSGQASEHLRKLRQQDAISSHSRMNSDAMSTLSRTLKRRTPSDAARARPASVLLPPTLSTKSLSTAAMSSTGQKATSPISTAQATKTALPSATSALASLRNAGVNSPRASGPTVSQSLAASGEAQVPALSGARTPIKNGKGRPAPLARAFESMDPTSTTRPGSVPQSPRSPYSPSPTASGGARSPLASPRGASASTGAAAAAAAAASPQAHATQLDAALAEAEAKSRLHTEGRCSVCGHRCENAPVSRSGERWCSRECRMEGKRRVGSASAAQVAVSGTPALQASAGADCVATAIGSGK